MTLNRLVASLGIALALSAAGSVAQAGTIAIISPSDPFNFGTLNFSSSVSISSDPTNADAGFSGAFDNVFAFTQGNFASTSSVFAGIDLGLGLLTAEYRFREAGMAWGATTSYSTTTNGPVNQNQDGFFSLEVPFGALKVGHTYEFEIRGDTGASGYAGYSLTLSPTTVASVPEPDSLAMLATGLGLLVAVARRRRSIASV